MARSRRESHHNDGITDQKSLQRTSATKSAQSGHPTVVRQCPLLGVKRTSQCAYLMSGVRFWLNIEKVPQTEGACVFSLSVFPALWRVLLR